MIRLCCLGHQRLELGAEIMPGLDGFNFLSLTLNISQQIGDYRLELRRLPGTAPKRAVLFNMVSPPSGFKGHTQRGGGCHQVAGGCMIQGG